MENINILLVEDDINISNVIKAYLEKEDYKVFLAYDGEKAIEIFENEDLHLIILDLMIPKLSGQEVCKIIRGVSNIPIIMLTAKVQEDDKIEGLAIGADDYVSKPFSPKELISRVKALLRRSYRDNTPLAEVLSFNSQDLELNIEKMSVKKNKKKIDLTVNEFKILLALVSNPDQVLSREQLISSSFGYDYEGFDRTIDTHIKNIRQKIEDKPKAPDYIKTVYGAGYKFETSK